MDINKKSKLINMIGMVELLLVIAVMAIGVVKGFLTNSQSNILVGIGLFIFWAISDIAEPYFCERFQDIRFTMREAYVKYLALDLIGYAGILYFLAGVGGSGRSSGLLGAVVFVVTMRPKRENLKIFYGLETVEEEEEEAAQEISKDEEE